MMRKSTPKLVEHAPSLDPIPFPAKADADADAHRSEEGEEAISAVRNVSRRLEDLARKLNCLGFFDETDPDRPRAA